MKKNHIFLTIMVVLLSFGRSFAETDYKESTEYLTLRDSMRHAFNDGDSARFFIAVASLEDYLLEQGDLHAYYTQRCNEIVFQMNSQKIFEAYKLAKQLSKELREQKLDKEMYMAVNMMGHINRYCGNNEVAKQCWRRVIAMMEKEGYYESIPPIYINMVNVELNDDPEEARLLLDKAREIAVEYSPERVFDIDTRKTLINYNEGKIDEFLKGYQEYRKGVEEGKSSVHGRTVEVYYQALMGNVDKAVDMAREMGDEGKDVIVKVYEQSGRWQDAYEALKSSAEANDSINNVVLSNSVMGIQDELELYEEERAVARVRLVTLIVIISLLALLVAALVYIVFIRRRHMRQLTRAYQHALESDRMKTAFIQNVSHEVRTPLNVISGFVQVLANPEMEVTQEERKEYAAIMQKNTRLITSLIDEMLELSLTEATSGVKKEDSVEVGRMLEQLAEENREHVNPDTELRVVNSLPAGFTILTNETILRRMMSLLLDNAMKNTEEGAITLRATADDKSLTLMVEDTGCGIPAEEAEHIFERFVKLDTFKEGLGLGLTLCRMLARRMGGDIVLDTTYGEETGARFNVTLPL